MSKCKLCNIEVLDETERCPLCHSVLEHTIEVENMYPEARVMTKKMMLWARIYLFIAILLEAVLIWINYCQGPEVWWSIITGLGLLYVYIVIRFAILGKTGYRAKTIILTVMAILMLVAIDWLAGYHGWSVNYVLPSGILFLDVAILFLMIINHRNWQSYMMWQLFTIVLSSIPLGLYFFFDVITNPMMSGLAFSLSVALFVGTLIIGDKRARVELKRKFHIR